MVNVLYIDDDEGLARLLKKTLAPEGMTVVHAVNGLNGLELLGTHCFDVIALDHNLISETGLDLMPKLIHAMNGDLPIIYVTGSDDVRVAVAALKAGAVDYVWKDLEGHYRELLVQSIKSALQQRQLQKQQEEAQRAIAAAKERAELLLAEVNHRVANSLALVASLASFQANAVDDEGAKAALNEMKARILAIAGIHRRLYTSTDVRNIELDAYLKNLGEELGGVLGNDASTKTIKVISDASVRLSTDRAISLAVIVTELVTNAYKYAYPNNQGGDIRVILQRPNATRLSLAVEDDGIGWTGTSTPKGTGLGTRIISAMARGIDGTLTYEPKKPGTRATLDFALLGPRDGAGPAA